MILLTVKFRTAIALRMSARPLKPMIIMLKVTWKILKLKKKAFKKQKFIKKTLLRNSKSLQ